MILSIESSCDDSSIALTSISDYKIIFHQKISQDKEHSLYGGVVPEIASRLHAISLPKILEHIKPYFKHIKAIAVTNEPGLSVSLIEGVMMAKTLSISLNLPLISINHLKGHIYSLFLEQDEIFPLSILLLSGGHSLILETQSHNEIKIIANTLDDSFGESFDKVAKMLSLGYPGGPIVEHYATNLDNTTLSFPIPLNNKNLAFSFSGLKNAVRLEIERRYKMLDSKLDSNMQDSRLDSIDSALDSSMQDSTLESKPKLRDSDISEICHAFQKAAITHISKKTRLYLQDSTIKHFGIVGGASANKALRARLISLCEEFNKEILFAPLEFCSDNAAMIGRCAIKAYQNRDFTSLESLDISPHSRIFT